MAHINNKYKVLKTLRKPGKKHEIGEIIELTDKTTIEALIKAGAIEAEVTTQIKEEKK